MNSTSTTAPYPTYTLVLVELYNIVGVVFAFLGNSLVLLSSVKYKAIDMDKTSILLLQNLTVADFLIALMAWLPTTIATVTGRWVLGDWVCFISGVLVNIPGFVELLLLTAISTHKVYTLVNPLRSRQRPVSRGTVVLAVAGFWGLALCYVVLLIFILGQHEVYDAATFSCRSKHREDKHHAANGMTIAFLVVAIPALITIIIANLALLSIVARHNSKKYKDLGGNHSHNSADAAENKKKGKGAKKRVRSDDSSVSLSVSRESSGKLKHSASRESLGRGKAARQNINTRLDLDLPRSGVLGKKSYKPGKAATSTGSVFYSPNEFTRAGRPALHSSTTRAAMSMENLLPPSRPSSTGDQDPLDPLRWDQIVPASARGSPMLSTEAASSCLQLPPETASSNLLGVAARDLSRSRELLCKISKKLSSTSFTLSRKAILMVSGVSWLFILSILPLILQNIWTTVNPGSALPPWFSWFQAEIYYLNVACNPVIYTLHSTRFRTFVKGVIRFKLQSLRRLGLGEGSEAGLQTEQVAVCSEM